MNKSYERFDHDAFAKTRDEQDFWGQIKRTVNGKPVPESQIQTIVDIIVESLALNSTDTLLDLACGNGALTHRIIDSCDWGLGVDSSDYLIQIASKYFEKRGILNFHQSDVLEYVSNEGQPEQFSKVLCYGSFSYFSDEMAGQLLRQLYTRFTNVKAVYIGNLPDRDRLTQFFTKYTPTEEETNDHQSRLGIWRTKDDFQTMAEAAKWGVEIREIREELYSSHYRFDALLTR